MCTVKTISAGFTHERGFMYKYECNICGEWSRDNFAEGEVENEDAAWEEVHERCTCPKVPAESVLRTYQHRRKK